jgi:hypothetical protein
MTRLPPSVDEALRAAIRAELNMLFEEKLKPLIEPRQIEAMQVSATPLFVSTVEAAKMVGRLGWDSPSVGARQPPSADTRRGAFCRIKVDDPRVVQRCRGWGDRAGSGVAPTGAGNQGHDLPRVIGASRGTVERPVACSAKFVAAEAYFERYGVPPLDDEAVERIEAEWRGDEPPKRSRRRVA